MLDDPVTLFPALKRPPPGGKSREVPLTGDESRMARCADSSFKVSLGMESVVTSTYFRLRTASCTMMTGDGRNDEETVLVLAVLVVVVVPVFLCLPEP